MSPRPLILLSNDDGVSARGLRTLREALMAIADVVVVAPRTEQSANSHSLTLHRPLRHKEEEPGIHWVDGTPADCIYVALYHEPLLPRWPDLCVSGINHGYNLGTDTFYSGTVAAAREAALRGLPSMALSVGPKGSFEEAARVGARLAAKMIEAPGRHAGERGALLNVNFPPGEAYRGIRPTCLGRRIYEDAVTVRDDPRGRQYFWIGGPGAHHEPMEGSDTAAVDEGHVSVTPLLLDVTDPDDLGLAGWVAGVGVADDEGRGDRDDR